MFYLWTPRNLLIFSDFHTICVAYNGEVMTKMLQRRYLSCFIIITTVFLSIFVSSVLLLVANIKIIKAENDNLAPKEHHVSVSITNPPADVQTVLEKSIIINGTANSGGSGINRVEAFVQKMPLNGIGQYKLTTPIREGNWSRWSFPVTLNDTGSYIVRARVTDNAGEQNWADVTIVFPSHIYTKKIGLIEPTFTYAAYHTGSFYDFYAKYSFKHAWYANKTITTDPNLLKNRPIPNGPFPYYAHPQFLDVPYISLIKFTRDHLLQVDPFVTNLTDVDVHEGKIFHSDGSNAYDVLFMYHNEYVTASEYNNLRQFVSNGGTLVLMEGNRLYAEVSYNKTNDSITLVKGHNWEFVDDKGATPSVPERWLNESKEWTGSNFFDVPSDVKVYFRNNPFNYTHEEEQHVTNPRAKILINYETTYSSNEYPNATIATYYMDYGKGGRVIDLSIWTHSLLIIKHLLSILTIR